MTKIFKQGERKSKHEAGTTISEQPGNNEIFTGWDVEFNGFMDRYDFGSREAAEEYRQSLFILADLAEQVGLDPSIIRHLREEHYLSESSIIREGWRSSYNMDYYHYYDSHGLAICRKVSTRMPGPCHIPSIESYENIPRASLCRHCLRKLED